MMRRPLCTIPWNTIIRLQENSLNVSNLILFVGHNFALRHYMWGIRDQTQHAHALTHTHKDHVWLLQENAPVPKTTPNARFASFENSDIT